MTSETYNFWNIIIQTFSALVSMAVGGAVLWYTLETHKLRVSTEDQVDLLRAQSARAAMPFAQPTFKEFAVVRMGDAPESGLSLRIENPVAASAFYVGVILMTEGQWHVALETIPLISGGETLTHLTRFRATSNPAELRSLLASDYPDLPEALFLCLLSKEPYVATVALDRYGREYLVKRRVRLNPENESITHYHARMEYPPSE
jgi:hypothetical protein